MHPLVRPPCKLFASVLILGCIARYDNVPAFRPKQFQQSLGIVLIGGVNQRLGGFLRRPECPLARGR